MHHLVSLEDQVYSGLKQYLEDYKARDEQVAKVLLRLESLKQSLSVINAFLPNLQTEHPTVSQVVSAHLAVCRTELQAIEDAVQRQASTSTTDARGKMKEAKKRLKFPFDRSELDKLDSRLVKVVQALSIAIDGLNLSSLSLANEKLNRIDSSSVTTTTALTEIRGHVNDSRVTDAAFQNSLNDLGATLTTIQTKSEENSSTLGVLSRRLTDVDSGNVAVEARINEVSAQLITIPGSITSPIVQSISRLGSETNDAREATAGRLDIILASNQGQTEQLANIRAMLESLVAPSTTSREESDIRRLAVLLSRPAGLKVICDEFANNPEVSSMQSSLDGSFGQVRYRKGTKSITEQTRFVRPCGCRHRRRRFRYMSPQWLSFSVFEETTVETMHERSCPMSQLSAAKGNRHMGLAFTGMRRLLSKAISIGFSMSYGAGGHSIGPMLRYYATVAWRQSPAFIISNLTASATARLDNE